MKKFIFLILFLLTMALFGALNAQETKFQYIGVKKCKMCHKGVKKGKIFEKWQSLRHSKAYTTLTTDAAKRVAKEAGVKGDPQKAAECLVCHVTAYSTPASHKASSLTMEEGVSCEACHGPGSEYKSVKVMKGVFKGIMKGVDYGLVKPDVTSCKKCHNAKSPTYKPFKFEAALKIIAHPTPKN